MIWIYTTIQIYTTTKILLLELKYMNIPYKNKKNYQNITLFTVQFNETKYWKYILIMTRVLLTLFLHYKYYCFSYFQTEISNANTTFYCKFSVYIFALEIKLKKKKQIMRDHRHFLSVIHTFVFVNYNKLNK